MQNPLADLLALSNIFFKFEFKKTSLDWLKTIMSSRLQTVMFCIPSYTSYSIDKWQFAFSRISISYHNRSYQDVFYEVKGSKIHLKPVNIYWNNPVYNWRRQGRKKEGCRSKELWLVERTCNLQFCCNRSGSGCQNSSVFSHRNKARFCYKQLLLACADSKGCEKSADIRLRNNIVWCLCQRYICFWQWCIIFCQNSASEHVMFTCTGITSRIQCSSGTDFWTIWKKCYYSISNTVTSVWF